MWRTCEGFRAGVKSIDRNIKAQVIYNENGSSEKLFIDDAWGYETGQTLIQRGADVIFAAGGATGQGALRAAAEAQVNAIGAERDQAAVLGGSNSSVVTSILGSTSFEVWNVIRLLREGNVNKLEKGQITYMPLNQKFPESLSQGLDVLLLKLQNGETRTNVTFSKP
jgi:basic membrane protein A